MTKNELQGAKARKSGAKASADTSGSREPRGARRKRETRRKLMDAAFRLMAERGMDAVAVNEITEAADVGLGSFYNHFETKEAIYSAVMDELYEEFADALESLVRDTEDPAEIIAVCVRHTVLRAHREPLWGKFLLREGLSVRTLSRGLGVRLMRDIQSGIAQGRFVVPDPLMTLISVGSSVLGAIAAETQPEVTEVDMLTQMGVDTKQLPERIATVLLTHLGLDFEEASEVARRALPVLEIPKNNE